MADRADLLRAVLAEPRDDNVRLIYADWLDEHDEADRAELIRSQCELERELAQPYKSLHDHIRQLMEIHGDSEAEAVRRYSRWEKMQDRVTELTMLFTGRMNPSVRYDAINRVRVGQSGLLTWSRGFISKIEATCEDLLAWLPLLWDPSARVETAQPLTSVKPTDYLRWQTAYDDPKTKRAVLVREDNGELFDIDSKLILLWTSSVADSRTLQSRVTAHYFERKFPGLPTS